MNRWWIALIVLAGCADTQTTFSDGPGRGGDGLRDGPRADTGPLADLPPPGEQVIYTGEPVVYAHSADKLYKVDPTTLQVTLIAPFKWPTIFPDQMTDIALDRDGKMVGISYTVVYSVDPKTAVCTRLADLDSGGASFNGLSYVASDIADGKELLMAAAGTGLVYEIDPATGKSKSIGNYGGPGSSGDIVSVKGLGTFATVKQSPGFGGTDWLAKVDVLTGKATLIGDTGATDIWGLGFWKNKFYGFTEGSQFVLIDPKTGKATTVSSGGGPWWGAGVTTAAPVID